MTDVQKDCHHPADHPPEEGIRSDVDRHERSLPPDPDRMDGPDRLSALRRSEGAEVVPALEDLPGSCHRGDVQRNPHPECEALADWTTRPVPDGVAVFPIPRRTAWVEPFRHRPDVADRDIPSEPAVERRSELCSGQTAGVCEPDHLPERMNSGVRPAGPVDGLSNPIAEVGKGRLELSLDRP